MALPLVLAPWLLPRVVGPTTTATILSGRSCRFGPGTGYDRGAREHVAVSTKEGCCKSCAPHPGRAVATFPPGNVHHACWFKTAAALKLRRGAPGAIRCTPHGNPPSGGNATAIAIGGAANSKFTGGPEALVQLALAFTRCAPRRPILGANAPTRTERSQPNTPRWRAFRGRPLTNSNRAACTSPRKHLHAQRPL